MPSSISSSEPRATSASLALPVAGWAAAALIGWVLVCQFALPEVVIGQTQNATNRIRAEAYLDAVQSPRFVVAGSSLSYRLPAADLGPETVNLAFAGRSPLTGISLVEGAPLQPARVLIEINELDRARDDSFIAALDQEPWRSLRGTVKAARHAYQPMNLLFGLLKGGAQAEDRLLPASMRTTMIDRRRVELATPADQALLDRHAEAIAGLANKLAARGIKVAFFEMPIQTGLAGLPGPSAIRATMHRHFPADQWCWISLDLPPAETNDGEHLLPADAARTATQLTERAGTCQP